MVESINKSVCMHVGVSSEATATISMGISPMLAPDDFFIPVVATTVMGDLGKSCPCCGRPYYDTTR